MKRGYSLIELIVVLTIILLLVAGILAGYTNYTEQQRARQTVLNIKSVFKTALVKAMASDQTDFCDVYTNPLAYYQVAIGTGAITLSIYCRDGTNNVISSETLPSRFTVTSATVRYYSSVTQPTSLAANTQISVQLGSLSPIRFTVNKNGTITGN